MPTIILVDTDRYQREICSTSIKICTLGKAECLTSENPDEAVLHINDDIIGVICGLNFPPSEISKVTGLAKECQSHDIPLAVCISREKDKPTKNQLAILDSQDIKYTIAEEGDKDWELTIKMLGLKV